MILKVENKIISVSENNKEPLVIVAANTDYTVSFEFDDEWEGLEGKNATFARKVNGEMQYLDQVLDENNSCNIPIEIIISGGFIYIGVYATEISSSNEFKIKVEKSIRECRGTEAERLEEMIQRDVDIAVEDKRVDLSNALTESDEASGVIPPGDFSDRSFEQLIDIVSMTQIFTESRQQEIAELNTIKAKAAETNLNNPIESIDFWKYIEAQTAKDTQGITVLAKMSVTWTVPIRIPRLDTAHIIGYPTSDGTGTFASSYAYLSPYVISFDIDISGLGANGLALNEDTFTGGYRGMSSGSSLLENATFRGCRNIKNLRRVMNGVKTLKTVEFYDLGELSSLAYAFQNCINLETISGSELNLTGLTTTSLENTFAGCENLKEVRFKADTINANISLSQSALLTKASVLSLINGLMEDVNCTVSLNGSIKNLCIMSYAHQVGNLWVSCEVTDEGAETYGNIITGYKHWTLN